jgi:hypothetical protein
VSQVAAVLPTPPTHTFLAAPWWQALSATSRSYVLASLQALHLDLRLVASDQAAAEVRQGTLQDGG